MISLIHLKKQLKLLSIKAKYYEKIKFMDIASPYDSSCCMQ